MKDGMRVGVILLVFIGLGFSAMANSARFEKTKYVAGQKGKLVIEVTHGWACGSKTGDKIEIGRSLKVNDFEYYVYFWEIDNPENNEWIPAVTTGYWAKFDGGCGFLPPPDPPRRVRTLVLKGSHGPKKTQAHIVGPGLSDSRRAKSPWDRNPKDEVHDNPKDHGKWVQIKRLPKRWKQLAKKNGGMLVYTVLNATYDDATPSGGDAVRKFTLPF